MSKRLTDTDKWKKPFIKGLPVEYKLFWLYLLDDCDIAGVWHVDFEVAELRLGLKLSHQKAQGLLIEKVVVFDNGTKWFVPDFIGFQYGVLTEKNKMYNSVTSILNKYNLMGHLSPIYGGKSTVKVKDIKEGGTGETKPPIVIPLPTDNPHAPKKEDVHEVFIRNGSTIAEADRFFGYYDSLGWKLGNTPITKFQSLVPKWLGNVKPEQRPVGQTLKTSQEILNERNKK